MTVTASAPHPNSVAALQRSAQAHELAAAVLHTRNPAASKAHADNATRLRARMSTTPDHAPGGLLR